MNLLIYEWKEKLNRMYIFVIYLIMLIILIGYNIMRYSSDSAMYLQSIQGMQISALFVLVAMTFLSYEIFCDFQKREWRDLLSLKKNGLWKVILAKDILLIIMIVVEFTIVFVIELVKLKMISLEVDSFIIQNLCRVLILNYLMLPIVGIMLGKAAALIFRKRWSGYICILTILLFTCGLFERINMVLYRTIGINLDKIFRFFQFEQPNSHWVVDSLYLIPAEDYRFFLFGTWITGGCVLVFASCIKRKIMRFIMVSVSMLLCIFCGMQTANPGNCVNYNMNTESSAYKQVEFENDESEEEIKADFTVEKCKMNLRITDELEAQIILSLGQDHLEKYHFTLYRGYEITEMTDEYGNLLNYDQENDFITVYNPGNISEIHMNYHGYQQSFYSNQFGVMLPGYFAYYPQPGFRKVFLNEIVQMYLYYGFNTETDFLQETEYEISVQYNKPVYSNLGKNKDIFFGKTIAPTIMGGAAIEEFRKADHYLYPKSVDLSHISLDALKSDLSHYGQKLGIDSEIFMNLKHVIVVPSSVYIGNSWGRNVIVGDCLFIGTDQSNYDDMDELALEIIKQYINVKGERDILLNVMISFLKDAMYMRELKPMDEQQFFSVHYDAEDTESEVYWNVLEGKMQERMFLTLIERCESEDVLCRVTEYLMDPNPKENSAEFMQRLYLELEG